MGSKYKLTKESFEKNVVEESLKKYPCDSKSHQYFSFYLSYKDEYFAGNRPYLFFNNVEDWDDPEDRKKFKEVGKKYFVRCLTYQPSESIAMWRIYGYPGNVLLKFDGPYIRKSLGLIKKGGKKCKTLRCILSGDFKEFEVKMPREYLEVYDVLYVGKATNKPSSNKDLYYVEKGSFNSKKIEGHDLRKINRRYLKRAAYAYERETRFFFVLDDDRLKKILKSSKTKQAKNITYEQVKGIKVYLDRPYSKKNIFVYKLPSFLKPKEKDKEKSNDNDFKNLEKFEYVQKLERIDSWNLKVRKSVLDDGSDF